MFWYDFPYEASDEIKREMSQHLVRGWTLLRILPFILMTLALLVISAALILNLKVQHVLRRKISKHYNQEKSTDSSSGYSSKGDEEEQAVDTDEELNLNSTDNLVIEDELVANSSSSSRHDSVTSDVVLSSENVGDLLFPKFKLDSKRMNKPIKRPTSLNTLPISNFFLSDNNRKEGGTEPATTTGSYQYSRNAMTTPVQWDGYNNDFISNHWLGFES